LITKIPVSLEVGRLFRTVFHLLLIADLLACPLWCTSGLPGSCCQSGTQQASAPAESEPAQPCCCSQENNPSQPAPPNNTPPAPQKTPDACPCDCICKGAICARPLDTGEPISMGWFDVLPVAVAISTEFGQLYFFSSSYPAPAESGRSVRILLMSYLC
jgi:hypothetical protein